MKTRFLGIVSVIVFSSMFVGNVYGSIYLDKGVYTWTDKVNIRVTEHGVDSENTSVKIYTSDHELKNYKLAKAGNGLYTGEIILTGFAHDVNGDGKSDTNPRTISNGPNNGFLESNRDDEFTISIRFGDGDEIKKTAKIHWNVGTIEYDRIFGAGESIRVKINDIDMNLKPETVDKMQIHAYSDSDKAGIVLDAIERQDIPGTFETIFSLWTRESGGNSLFALHDDTVYVQYNDYTLPKPYGVNEDMEVIAELTPFTLEKLGNKKIEWSQGNYAVKNGTGTAKIIVSDFEKNILTDNTETIQVSIFSDSSREGIVIDLYETDKKSGIFERTFAFSDKRSAPNILLASEGDTVTALYAPALNENSENMFMVATMFLGLTGPPLERAPVTAPRISDLDYNTIIYPVVGEQVLFTSDIANQQNHNQSFVWIAQIMDSEKKPQALSWIEGTLNPLSSFSPATSWIPTVAGDYKVAFFVWESITNPTALSPPIELDFTVLDERLHGQGEDDLPPEDLLAKQEMIEQLRTIPRDEPEKNLTDTARDFVISEALKNNQVSSILEGYTYSVECCSFSVDRQNPTLNQHVGLKFHVEEKYLFVTVTYDLKQEKVIVILKNSSEGFAIIPVEK